MYRDQIVPDPTVADDLAFDSWPAEVQQLAQRVLKGGEEVRGDGRSSRYHIGNYPLETYDKE